MPNDRFAVRAQLAADRELARLLNDAEVTKPHRENYFNLCARSFDDWAQRGYLPPKDRAEQWKAISQAAEKLSKALDDSGEIGFSDIEIRMMNPRDAVGNNALQRRFRGHLPNNIDEYIRSSGGRIELRHFVGGLADFINKCLNQKSPFGYESFYPERGSRTKKKQYTMRSVASHVRDLQKMTGHRIPINEIAARTAAILLGVEIDPDDMAHL